MIAKTIHRITHNRYYWKFKRAYWAKSIITVGEGQATMEIVGTQGDILKVISDPPSAMRTEITNTCSGWMTSLTSLPIPNKYQWTKMSWSLRSFPQSVKDFISVVKCQPCQPTFSSMTVTHCCSDTISERFTL